MKWNNDGDVVHRKTLSCTGTKKRGKQLATKQL